MAHLLKRTKKTCLKFIRKLSSSKQMYIKQLEEEEPEQPRTAATTAPPAAITANREAKHARSGEQATAAAPKKRNSTESLPLPTTYCWKSYDHDDDADDVDDESLVETRAGGQGSAMLQSLTSKLFLTANGYEFQRLQQQVLPYEGARARQSGSAQAPANDAAGGADGATEAAVFERVKYKEHVRYFRHTPSSSSLDNSFPAKSGHGPGAAAAGHSSMAAARTTASSHGRLESSSHLFLPMNVSLGSRLNGNFQNVLITEERDCYNKLTPVVKWDINGNSLDDDSIFVNDNCWDDYDFGRIGGGGGDGAGLARSQFQDKRCAQLKSADSQKSLSYRSSSTTLETWLDDECNESAAFGSLQNNQSDYNFATATGKQGLLKA